MGSSIDPCLKSSGMCWQRQAVMWLEMNFPDSSISMDILWKLCQCDVLTRYQLHLEVACLASASKRPHLKAFPWSASLDFLCAGGCLFGGRVQIEARIVTEE